MSPEVAYQKNHTVGVDIWCLGVLLYEMLHGRAPFKARTLEQIKKEYISKNVMIKSSLNSNTKDLLKKLL